LQLKIVFTIVCSILVALILAIIGFFVYRYITGPSLEKMINYMEEKYEEEFVVVAVNTQVWTAEYTDIMVKPSKNPDDIVTVRTYMEAGKRIYEDNYIPILRREEFDAAYQKMASEVYGKCKVFATSIEAMTTLPAEIDKNTKINDILSNPNVRGMISIFVEADTTKKDEQIEALRLKLKEKKWFTLVDIYYLNKGGLNQNLKKQEDILENVNTFYLTGRMILSKDFEITTLRWESN
jgi:hypothetical protein